MGLKEAGITLIFFIVVTLIFFYKIFLGLIPLPADLIVGGYYPWLSYKWGYTTGVPVKNTKLSDSVSLFYPLKALVAQSWKEGEFILWNPYMFGGSPLFASVSFGLLFPTMIFYLIFQAPIAWTLQTMSQPILASFFMYLFLRHLKLDKIPSIFGSIAFGFGGFTILWMQWNTQATTALFFPLLILLLDKYLISMNPRWGILFSITLTLQIFAGYLPILPLTILGLVIWYVFKAKGLSSLKILFFVFLGVLLSAVYLLPVAELIQISQRKIERLGAEGPFTPPENFINLIAPDFFGNDATGNFWGRGDHMDATLYIGVTTLIFALMSTVIFFKRTEVKIAVCLFVVAVVISISNPLSVLLYKSGLWGGPSITMNRVNFLINFALSILGAYGLSVFKKSSLTFSLKPVLSIAIIALGIIGGLLISKQILLQGLNAITVTSEVNSSLTRINISLRNFILPAFLIAITFLLIYLSKKYRFVQKISAFVFILILVFELFRFGLKFNTFSKPSLIYPQTPITDFLEKYPNDRFIAEQDILPANMWVPFTISSIGGYETIYPLNIAKLLAVSDSANIDATPMTKWAILQNLNSKILDGTNTRFLLTLKKDREGKPSSSGEINSKFNISKYKKIFEDKEVAILENITNLEIITG
ncbi:YfhO family protein [Candidatus Daviesbacteria bacterium]|nr:YfhO family protein [Candidatus Daviesbacteria bacterium]